LEKNTWGCRKCGIKGGFTKFFEVIAHLEPAAAAAKAREYADTDTPMMNIDLQPNEVLDRNAWVSTAWNIIDNGVEDLVHDEAAKAFLREERGLSDETMRRHRLGLVQDFTPMWRSTLGLKPSYQNMDGRTVRKVILPAGILIPNIVRGKGPVGLLVRCWDATYGRYRWLPGSELVPLVITGTEPAFQGVVVITESYLCGIKMNADTGVAVVALGGVKAPLSEDASRVLANAEVIVLAMDDDDAGIKAAMAYEAAYENAVSSTVPNGKDVTDAWLAGLDLRIYLIAAIHRARRILQERRPRVTHRPAPAELFACPPAITCEVPVTEAPHALDGGRPDHVNASPITPAAPVVLSYLQPRTYRYVTDPVEAVEAVLQMVEENNTLAINIETAKLPEYAEHPKAGLDPSLSRIRLIQLCGRSGDALIIDAFACAAGLREILVTLSTRKLVAHNAVFEMKHLTHIGVPVKIMECTMLMWSAQTNETYSMLDPRDSKLMALSLKSVLRRNTGVEIAKELQQSDWGRDVLTAEQLEYAADDVLHLVRLHDMLLNQLRVKKLEPVYTRMRDTQRAIVDLELGIDFDTAGHAEMVSRWQAEAELLKLEVRAVMGQEINLNSKPQLDAFLRSALPKERLDAWPKTPKGMLSTTEADLEANADMEVFAPLLQLRKLEKMLTTYGEEMANVVNPITGKVAASFHLAGAVTGRMSSSSPSFQNLPRGEFRKIFMAEAGHMIIAADYSQIELRVAALLANDRLLLQAYRNGVDIHRLTAAMVLDVEMDGVTKAQRQMAKAVSFGTLYGQGSAGLAIRARSFGVTMTVDEAKQFQKRLFEAYPQLRHWREGIRDAARRKASARTRGGRVRHFAANDTSVFPKSLNTPVQGTASEIQLRALTLVAEGLRPFGAHLVNAVHDEIVVTCGEGDAGAVEVVLRDCMTQAFLEMFPDAPTTGLVECGMGSNWAEAK
jgi:DNA polymerase-1